MRSIGLVEMPNLTDAIETLDVMLKTAGVSFVAWEKTLGGRLVTLIITGDTAAVQEAVASAHRHAQEKIAVSVVIANPHPETWRLAEISASKIKPL